MDEKSKLVTISKGAFIFCRYSVAILVILAFIFKLKSLILLTFLIMFFSALLKIKHAPLILLYNYTVNLLIKSKDEIVSEKGMQFAHILGAIFSFIILLFLYWINASVGWVLVVIFAVLKIISALGFCPASKLYVCMSSGGCCSFSKKFAKKGN